MRKIVFASVIPAGLFLGAITPASALTVNETDDFTFDDTMFVLGLGLNQISGNLSGNCSTVDISVIDPFSSGIDVNTCRFGSGDQEDVFSLILPDELNATDVSLSLSDNIPPVSGAKNYFSDIDVGTLGANSQNVFRDDFLLPGGDAPSPITQSALDRINRFSIFANNPNIPPDLFPPGALDRSFSIRTGVFGNGFETGPDAPIGDFSVDYTFSITTVANPVQSVPVPAPALLLLTALAGLGFWKRRQA